MQNSNAKKLDRSGNSHAGRTMRIFTPCFYGEKLSAIARLIFGALISYTQKDKRADFTYAELCKRYRVSPASVARVINKAIASVVFEREGNLHTYKRKDDFTKETPCYFYILDWLRHARFEVNGENRELTETEVEILSFLIHQNAHYKHWTGSQAQIARTLEIAPSTVSKGISRLEQMKIGGKHFFTVSGSDLTMSKAGDEKGFRAPNSYVKTYYIIDMQLLSQKREEVVEHEKKASREVQAIDAKTARELFYERRQSAAYNHAKAVQRALGEDFSQLEKTIRELELQAVKAERQKRFDLVQKILAQRAAVQAERKKMLEESGYIEADLLPRFFCLKCRDTGWRISDGRMCDCYGPPKENA